MAHKQPLNQKLANWTIVGIGCPILILFGIVVVVILIFIASLVAYNSR